MAFTRVKLKLAAVQPCQLSKEAKKGNDFCVEFHPSLNGLCRCHQPFITAIHNIITFYEIYSLLSLKPLCVVVVAKFRSVMGWIGRYKIEKKFFVILISNIYKFHPLQIEDYRLCSTFNFSNKLIIEAVLFLKFISINRLGKKWQIMKTLVHT